MTLGGITSTVPAPPIMAARQWLRGLSFSDDMPFIDVSQAAPTAPPPLSMREAMAEMVLTQDDTHLYGPILGNTDLRSALAAHWDQTYHGQITLDHIAITSGCNQAFCATIAALCVDGDDVILPAPWYFNHDMWLRMAGVKTQALFCDDTLLPDPEHAAALIGPRTKAIVLVSPNNPCGVEYPPALLRAFYDVCQSRGIALIVDETYKDFHSSDGAPHDLMRDGTWGDTLITLYSFSKAYRLTGHRVGAVIASPARIKHIEKFLDTLTICPAQLGQKAALWGLENLQDWVGTERRATLSKAKVMREAFAPLIQHRWRLMGVGAYFAYVEHPLTHLGANAAPAILRDQAVLGLPGTFFAPPEMPGAQNHLRLAFANIDEKTIEILVERLIQATLRLAPDAKGA
jgi:aspartate/methionine/tyrosine aminotransferase